MSSVIISLTIKMKISAIDIGSNSVRLAVFADGKTLYKRLETTRLGEGVSSGRLKEEAIERTARAVNRLFEVAQTDGAEKVYAFATAAVRSAENGQAFVNRVKAICGLTVEVLSGEEEAKCGISGALQGGDGGIIDVGGASTEVTVQKNGQVLYTKSVNIGTVRLYDAAARDKEKLLKVIKKAVAEYGGFTCPDLPIYAIGGTASRLGSIKHKLTEYRPEITDGTVLTLEEMYGLADKLLSMSVEEIRATTICGRSAEIVGGGCLLMAEVMNKFCVKEIIVSEKDNLEGYVLLKEGKL